MEPRLWSRDFISNASVIFRILARIGKTETDVQSHSKQFSCCVPHENPRNFSTQSRELKERHKKYLLDNLDNKKLQPINDHDKTVTQRREIRRILSTMTADKTKAFIKRGSGRLIISSLIYKTLLNLKDKDLIQANLSSDSDLGGQTIGHLDGQELRIYDHDDKRESDCDLPRAKHEEISLKTCQSDVILTCDMLSHSKHENFKQKMYDKYQEPSEERVMDLKRLFPDPEKLFLDVMRPARDAGVHCHEPVNVSSHLGGLYWKAKIQLLWPRKVSVIGMHKDRENAVSNAYLATCAQLMDLGLIANCQDTAQLVNCDTVVNILEQISEYGDSTIVSSKGKGFKIVLEKVKKNTDGLDEDLCFNQVDGKVCSEWQGCGKSSNDGRFKWSCCVHVGWPTPFSVRMAAPSLPSAQMLALLTVVSNLKVMGVLNKTNTEINPLALQQAVLRETSNEWMKCIQSSKAIDAAEPFDDVHGVDAKIYVDASNIGYGSYLVMKDLDKVSWLCESWLHQPQVFSKIFLTWNERIFLHSSVAELFALVSTIFSWKRKLQHRRLVCYSDNQTAVTLITTLKFTQPSNTDHFISVYDLLINSLQETCQAYNIQLHATWIQRNQNWLADRLANGDVHMFKAAVPNAAARKTKVKHLQLKDGLLCYKYKMQ